MVATSIHKRKELFASQKSHHSKRYRKERRRMPGLRGAAIFSKAIQDNKATEHEEGVGSSKEILRTPPPTLISISAKRRTPTPHPLFSITKTDSPVDKPISRTGPLSVKQSQKRRSRLDFSSDNEESKLVQVLKDRSPPSKIPDVLLKEPLEGNIELMNDLLFSFVHSWVAQEPSELKMLKIKKQLAVISAILD